MHTGGDRVSGGGEFSPQSPMPSHKQKTHPGQANVIKIS